MSKPETITVLVKEPLKNAEIREIPNTLEAKQAIVGGLIEAFPLEDKYDIYVNENGIAEGLQPNLLFLPYNVLLGTVFISRLNWEEGTDMGLTQEEIEEVTKMIRGRAVKTEAEANHYAEQIKKFM